MRKGTHRFTRAALLGLLSTVSCLGVASTVRAGHVNLSPNLNTVLLKTLGDAGRGHPYQKRKAAARRMFDAYCTSPRQRGSVSDKTVELIAREAGHTDEKISYFLLRTLGAMGSQGGPALPFLDRGVTATPSPDRFVGYVDVGRPVPVDQTAKWAAEAIRNDEPMSCDLNASELFMGSIDHSLRNELISVKSAPLYEERKQAVMSLFDTYCTASTWEKSRISDGTVTLIVREARRTDERSAYFLLRTLGAMGGGAKAALPVLRSGVVTTPSPDRFVGGVKTGPDLPIDRLVNAAIRAIDTNTPLSCDKQAESHTPNLDDTLRQLLAKTKDARTGEERKEAADAFFETYCNADAVEKAALPDSTVNLVVTATRKTEDITAYYLIRTLGAMGARASSALPALKAGVVTTVSPWRVVDGVEFGAPPRIEQVRLASIKAIETDTPMSCDQKTYY